MNSWCPLRLLMGWKCERIIMRNVSEKEKIGKREMNIIAIVAVMLWYVD